MDIRLLALGDSVVWGQGLLNREKFSSLFYEGVTGRAWEQDTGEDLRDLHARSGAVIEADAEDVRDAPDLAGVADKLARHEVPSAFPTVPQQVESIDPDDGADADVVILNGGANDFSVSDRLFTIEILSKEFGPRPAVEAEFEDIFHDRMDGLLDEALERFPRATIIVPGYYPILSKKSLLARMPVFLFLDLIALRTGAVTLVGSQLSFKRAKRQALFFHKMQLRHLRRVVAEKVAETGRRILFAHPRFGPQNAIAAWNDESERFVFEPDTPDNQPAWIRDLRRALRDGDPQLFATLIANIEPQRAAHEVSVVRRDACDLGFPIEAEAPVSIVDNISCRVAPIGHPTPEGSRRYGEALDRAWRSGHSVSLRERFGPLTGRTRGRFSLRSALVRYGLPMAEGVWLCGQLVDIDVLVLTVRTARSDFGGTDARVMLQVSDSVEWRLNEDIFQHDQHNDFRPGATDTFVIDPALEGDTLHLGDIEEVTLQMHANLDLFTGTWTPDALSLSVNGWTLLQARIGQPLNPRNPWTAPNFPADVG